MDNKAVNKRQVSPCSAPGLLTILRTRIEDAREEIGRRLMVDAKRVEVPSIVWRSRESWQVVM